MSFSDAHISSNLLITNVGFGNGIDLRSPGTDAAEARYKKCDWPL